MGINEHVAGNGFKAPLRGKKRRKSVRTQLRPLQDDMTAERADIAAVPSQPPVCQPTI